MGTDTQYGNTSNHQDFSDFRGDMLTYVKRGVLWVNKKPHYIVELVKEPDLTYVMVYGVHPGTENNPKKLATEVRKRKNVFSTKTLLGQIANRMIPVKETVKWEPKPPVFVAPVIPNQVATLTGRREDGFFEREPDRISSVGGEKVLHRGKNTGVFIGLSSIDWEDGYYIPTESILKTLNMYKQDMFYDLSGDNNNPNNPLSTYYKGSVQDLY